MYGRPKADDLSHGFLLDSPPLHPPQLIIPEEKILAVIQTDISEALLPAQAELPRSTPSGMLFKPLAFRLQMLQQIHASKPAAHSGSKQTFEIISCNPWRPSIKQDVLAFVQASEICARSKGSNSMPFGLPCPLLIPTCH